MQKLAYFPRPREGELVYSVVARFQKHVGASNNSLEATLFGQRVRINAGLPLGLPALAARLPEGYGLTLSELVIEHTLYPWFMNHGVPGGATRGTAMLVNGDSFGNLSHMCSGFIPEHLRFCPECFDQMVSGGREGYWRREHQLPFVLVCPFHPDRELLASIVKSKAPTQSGYRVADRETCQDRYSDTLIDLTPEQRRDLATIATKSVSDIRPWRGTLESKARLKDLKARIRSKDFYTRSSYNVFSSYFEKLITRFDYMNRLWHGRITNAAARNWVSDQSDCRSSPLWHYLTEILLSEMPERIEVFDNGPWKCLNKFGDHFGQPVVTEYVVGYSSLPGERVIRFSCSCGCTYRRKILVDGSLTAPIIITYGPALIGLVKHGLSQSLSAREIGRRHGLPHPRITKILRELGYAPSGPPSGKWIRARGKPKARTTE